MLIGILQTGASPDALRPQMGDYPDFFERLLAERGMDFRRYSVMDMEFPASVRDCDGWLITGSRFGAYEDHAFIPPLEAFIRDAYAAHVPMVGICFGHQIIAQAMGGKVEKFDGGWQVGPTAYNFGEQQITLNAWHQDQVVEKPQSASVIARNDFCANAALVYDNRIFTVQAHPEFRKDFMEGLIEKRGPGLVPDAILANATAHLNDKLDSDILAERIADFFLNSKRAEKLRA